MTLNYWDLHRWSKLTLNRNTSCIAWRLIGMSPHVRRALGYEDAFQASVWGMYENDFMTELLSIYLVGNSLLQFSTLEFYRLALHRYRVLTLPRVVHFDDLSSTKDLIRVRMDECAGRRRDIDQCSPNDDKQRLYPKNIIPTPTNADQNSRLSMIEYGL